MKTSDSEHSDDEHETFSLSDRISNWAIHFGISLVALTALLGILHICHPDLPKDARTLLRQKETKYSILERLVDSTTILVFCHRLETRCLSTYTHWQTVSL